MECRLRGKGLGKGVPDAATTSGKALRRQKRGTVLARGGKKKKDEEGG